MNLKEINNIVTNLGFKVVKETISSEFSNFFIEYIKNDKILLRLIKDRNQISLCMKHVEWKEWFDLSLIIQCQEKLDNLLILSFDEELELLVSKLDLIIEFLLDYKNENKLIKKGIERTRIRLEKNHL